MVVEYSLYDIEFLKRVVDKSNSNKCTMAYTIVFVTVILYQTIIIANFASCWICSYYLSKIHLPKVMSINQFYNTPPEHYKPSFQWKQRVLGLFLAIICTQGLLLIETTKMFNYSLALIDVIAATWIKIESFIVS